MRWRVEISERSGDDRLLRDVLEAIPLRLQEDGGRPFLAGEAFEMLETAGEVHKLACHVRSVLSEVGRAHPDGPVSFQIGQIVEKLVDGSVRNHAFAYAHSVVAAFGAAAFELVRGTPVLSDEDLKRIEEERKELEYQEKRHKMTVRLMSALNDERALRVQRWLQQELTTQRMWHILELIEDDMGGAIKDLAPKKQLTRFKHSVNHPDVHGEAARHIVSRQQPPSKPMKLEEARVFIRELAWRWLEKKAEPPPAAR